MTHWIEEPYTIGHAALEHKTSAWMYGSDYAHGMCKPRYPMPATIGSAYIGKYGVYIAHADYEDYYPAHEWPNYSAIFKAHYQNERKR